MSAGLATADWSGAVFCPTRCYPCQFDECPNVPHTWGGVEDFEHAWATFQDAPGFCGCECGRPTRPTRITIRRRAAQVPFFWNWKCPGCQSGHAFTHQAALADADRHRASAACRHRRAEA